jgi:hypothetical protein
MLASALLSVSLLDAKRQVSANLFKQRQVNTMFSMKNPIAKYDGIFHNIFGQVRRFF